MSSQRVSLKPWNTFGIDVYANNVIIVHSVESLFCNSWTNGVRQSEPVLLLGEGSNVLFLQDFRGKVLINRIKGISVTETTHTWLLHVGAGENWHQLVETTLCKGLAGLENLALIPGCVGSAPIQNIGAYGVELRQVCEYVDIILLNDGSHQRLKATECCFGYRDSVFKHRDKNHYAIIAVGLRLIKQWRPVLSHGALKMLNPKTVTPIQVFHTVCETRRSKIPNPKYIGNAGSFFKNPLVRASIAFNLLALHPKIPYHLNNNGDVVLSAAGLIDQCKLKGYRIGGAAVHDQQALVFINTGTASSEDIVNLARIVRRRVGEKFNIWLEPEVCFISSQGKIDALEVVR
ncbi:UDP-N-acetylenolpyruvoylglucosamine reductase [Candidatus Erwinia haradaeae]|uniref:UDP-N-acetylenolpyruvoylglucosamine reductase n=1 Tax=Candidatus Erwinia haradaeae TaxID=1922217 RepID=A0A451DJN2_9GAMM|nr:UDP-N-acetylmuramate dehydrogenase [Candidatus Erwinia haradaeae]VFP86891.1 UDP-N-acetylenolpyruvoylglucosamine reductase [Candidatus Erwinia haradaeae]